jgi:hypothetical protein
MRLLTCTVAAMVLAAAAACSNNNPSSPDSSTGSVTAPRPAQPAANASVRFVDQPVTLMAQNAAATRPEGSAYTFEVATDSAFSSKVQTKDNVAEGAAGQTAVRLDTLAGGRDYYWRVRATAGGTTGPFSPPSKFTVGPAIVVNPPVPIAPLTNSTTTPRPALRVTNATRSGPTGAITYLFEVASSAAFTTIVLRATNTEGVNETGVIPTADLPSATLFWRATAIDAANNVSSAPSAVQSFTTKAFSQAEAVALQLGVPLWPGATPPGSTGHATMGNDPALGAGWAVQTLYYAPAGVFFPSPDIEMLRFFDLFDRGFHPDDAVAWMNANGYFTNALWYPPPEKAVLGLKYVYIASRGKVFVNGTWDIVVRVE